MTETFLDKRYTYIVIGASNNEEKYGYKVTKYLKEQGYKVVPINPNEDVILDLPVVKNIQDVRTEIDVAVFVVPPKVTEQLIEELYDEGVNKIWFQPGSESKLAIDFCEKNDMHYIANACIMTTKE